MSEKIEEIEVRHDEGKQDEARSDGNPVALADGARQERVLLREP